jgi:hypothetical protein
MRFAEHWSPKKIAQVNAYDASLRRRGVTVPAAKMRPDVPGLGAD